MRSSVVYFGLALAAALVCAGWATSGQVAAQGQPAAAKAPAVAGAWTGTWGPYSIPKPGAPAPTTARPEAQLDCKVEALPDGKWQATFEGECGRPYKYTIKMLGRTSGGAVLFQGSADLGEKDGGVYDWIGRATDKEFVGFYTSQTHVGHFRLARPAAGG